MVKNVNITISSDDLVDAVTQSDEFGEAVKTVVREEMADDIAQILIDENDFFASETFEQAVNRIVDDGIEHEVDRAIDAVDILELVRNETTDYADEITEIERSLSELGATLVDNVERLDRIEQAVDIMRDRIESDFSNLEHRMSTNLSALRRDVDVALHQNVELFRAIERLENRLNNTPFERVKNFILKIIGAL
jgi:DNA repair exonuclease SbcCD ATPase subunit